MPLGGRGVIAPVSRLFTDSTEVGNVLTGQDDLMNFTMVADTVGADGGILIKAWGKLAANGNSKIIRVQIGTQEIFTVTTTVSGLSWLFEIYLLRTSELVQAGVVNSGIGTVAGAAAFASTVDLSTDLVVKLTAAATDTDDITQNGMIVELI